MIIKSANTTYDVTYTITFEFNGDLGIEKHTDRMETRNSVLIKKLVRDTFKNFGYRVTGVAVNKVEPIKSITAFEIDATAEEILAACKAAGLVIKHKIGDVDENADEMENADA